VDSGAPFFGFFIEGDASEAGGCIFSFGDILGVLRAGCEAEICLAVIEGGAIFVVNESAFGGVHNFPVEAEFFCFAGADDCAADGVEFSAVAIEDPFVASEAVVVGDIDDCEEAFVEEDSAVGVAEFVSSIIQYGQGT